MSTEVLQGISIWSGKKRKQGGGLAPEELCCKPPKRWELYKIYQSVGPSGRSSSYAPLQLPKAKAFMLLGKTLKVL